MVRFNEKAETQGLSGIKLREHMANPHALPKTKAVVRGMGYHCPDIMTPKTFLENLNLEGRK